MFFNVPSIYCHSSVFVVVPLIGFSLENDLYLFLILCILSFCLYCNCTQFSHFHIMSVFLYLSLIIVRVLIYAFSSIFFVLASLAMFAQHIPLFFLQIFVFSFCISRLWFAIFTFSSTTISKFLSHLFTLLSFMFTLHLSRSFDTTMHFAVYYNIITLNFLAIL